jgi:hypothetical protein
MKFFTKCKAGGPESTVTSYILIEIKSLFSIMLLRFANGSRDAYHSHAFNAVSWLLRGELGEKRRVPGRRFGFVWNRYLPSWRPIYTSRDNLHKVFSRGESWALTFRGPWADTWRELLPSGRVVTLTWGRKTLFSVRTGR